MTGPIPAETITLTTADGESLEARITAPPAAGRPPTAVAVICHPHPLYGGSMDNNVVNRLATDLGAAGIPTVRFNFRGVGSSTGSHGGGQAEMADVVAAIDAATAAHPGAPVVLAGYSFGADVSLSVSDDRISGWLAVSPPLRIVDPTDMVAATDPRPTVIVTGTGDDFRPADQAETMVASWPSTEVVAAAGVDHFWMQGLDQLAGAAERLLVAITADR